MVLTDIQATTFITSRNPNRHKVTQNLDDCPDHNGRCNNRNQGCQRLNAKLSKAAAHQQAIMSNDRVDRMSGKKASRDASPDTADSMTAKGIQCVIDF